jgi:hypothetical protein
MKILFGFIKTFVMTLVNGLFILGIRFSYSPSFTLPNTSLSRPDFRELEYREWLADVVTLVASKRGIADHDTKLISELLKELCEDWDYERADYLGYMIEARMKEKTYDIDSFCSIFKTQSFRFPIKQTNDLLSTLKLRRPTNYLIHGQSQLWIPSQRMALI